jgi:hypothetical protein
MFPLRARLLDTKRTRCQAAHLGFGSGVNPPRVKKRGIYIFLVYGSYGKMSFV